MADSTTTARVRLALEGASAVEQGLAKVQTKVSDVGAALVGLIGGLSVAGFAAWVKSAIDAADETSKIAQKTGLATEQVAGLQLAWAQAGGSADAFVPIMTKLNLAVANGNKALDAMGISSKNADGSLKTTRQVLGEVSDKFAAYDDGARKSALAVELLGKSGAEAIPFLNSGAQALNDFDDMAKRLGLTLDEETTANAEKFNDTLDLIETSAQGVGRQVAAQLLPTLASLTEEFFNNITQGENLKRVAEFLGGALKGLYSIGVGVVEVFKTMGLALGGTGAAIAAVLRGEFGQAKEIVNQMRADISASWAASGASIQRVWAGAGGSTVAALAAATKAAKENAPAMDSAGKASKKKSDADRDAARAAKELADIIKRNTAAADKVAEQHAKDADAVMESNQALREEIALIGANTAERAALIRAKEEEILADKEGLLMRKLNQGGEDATVASLQREIALRKERLNLLDRKTASEASVSMQEENDKAVQALGQRMDTEWDRTCANLADSLAGAIMAGFDSGKGFANGFFAYLGSQLKATFAKELSSSIQGALQSYLTGNTSNMNGTMIGAAYQYMTGASAGASGASMAYANMVGAAGGDSLGALYTANGGWSGVAAGSGAGASAGAGSASGTSAMGYMGYAALIAAAVIVAEGLYKRGWNRDALGQGQAKTYQFGRSSYTTDPTMGQTARYDGSFERMKRYTLQWAGFNDKWADILSGTVRMAYLFGRKLSGYGYEANIAGGDVSVGGYAKYKGGVFRSSKTVSAAIDPRDAEMLRMQIESVRSGAKGMAQAMGYSGDAIDAYTGKLRVNMKGANTAAEQSERMQKAMDDLRFSMLKAASGGKMARAEFDRLMEAVQADIQAAGISVEGMTGIVVDGMMNGASGEEIGAALSNMVIGGIYKTIAEQAFAPVAQAIMAQIVTPVFTALMAGVPVSQAISQGAIDSIVSYASAAAEALSLLFDNEEFRAAMEEMGIALADIGTLFGGVDMPGIGQQVDAAAEEIARQRAQMEAELLRLQGNTVELRRRELEALDPSLRDLQQLIWAREEENATMEERKGLERQLLELQGDTAALRKLERDALKESNRELYDTIKALEDAQKARDIWKDLSDSIIEEVNRLRDELLGTTVSAVADLEAQFAVTTAQARANNEAAAGKLPELSSQLQDMYRSTATSREEYQFQVASMLASMQQTASIVREQNGVYADLQKNTQTVRDDQLAGKVDGLQRVMTEHAGIMAKVLTALEDVTDGRVLRTKAVA